MNIRHIFNALASRVIPDSRRAALSLAGSALLTGASLLAMQAAFQEYQRSSLSVTSAYPSETGSPAVAAGDLQPGTPSVANLARQAESAGQASLSAWLTDLPDALGEVAKASPLFPASRLQHMLEQTQRQPTVYHDLLRKARSSLVDPVVHALPVTHPVPDSTTPSSRFGRRTDPITRARTFHEGIDFPGRVGLPIKAAGNGTVTFAGYHPEYGNMIDLDHGNGLLSRYAHNSRIKVRVGEKVAAGQLVALLGNSGRSTGPHLHFEIRYKNVPQDPMRFLAPGQLAANTPAARL